MTNITSNILSGMMDAFASIISNNLNTVMKFLASVTIIVNLPAMFSSFYGMNVNLPWLWTPTRPLLGIYPGAASHWCVTFPERLASDTIFAKRCIGCKVVLRNRMSERLPAREWWLAGRSCLPLRVDHMLAQELVDSGVQVLNGLRLAEAMSLARIEMIFMGKPRLRSEATNLIRLVWGTTTSISP